MDGLDVRPMRPDDISAVVGLQRSCIPPPFPEDLLWTSEHLQAHLRVFPEGQLVAVSGEKKQIVGVASSLIVFWDDYEWDTAWRDFTDHGMFTNHNPATGKTLYGAEVMVHPAMQGKKIGRLLYRARRDLCRRLGLVRILAGARLVGYHRLADRLSPEEYVRKVVNGELFDKTLTFQLKRGFHVVTVVPDYLENDPFSLGYAAVIEWLNANVAESRHYECCDPRFLPEGETVLKPGLIKYWLRRRKHERRMAREGKPAV